MTTDQRHIRDVFRSLGSRRHQTMLPSAGTPFMYRSTWCCGCAVDYIDAQVGAYQWLRCADHHQIGEASAR